LPRADERQAKVKLRPITGQPPSLLNPPSGCAFHPRCAYREVPGACDQLEPKLRAVEGVTHLAACHFADDLEERIRLVDAEETRAALGDSP
jgi:peptide/nickel transport system ATP-binding protein